MADKAKISGGVYSQSDLGRAINVSPQTVQQWLANKTSPRRARIEAIAGELGCDAVWLETGYSTESHSGSDDLPSEEAGQRHRSVEAAERSRVARIPYYPEVPVSAGHGCVPLDEAHITVIDISRELLERCGVAPGNAALLQSDGDSMKGVIEHGDLMVIDRSESQIREGRIFVVSVDGELLVKRVQRIPRGIKLVSENPVYDPITVMDDDQDVSVTVVGRVAISWSMTGFLQ